MYGIQKISNQEKSLFHRHFVLVVGVLFGLNCVTVSVYVPNGTASSQELWNVWQAVKNCSQLV